jgi:hypothetical protein
MLRRRELEVDRVRNILGVVGLTMAVALLALGAGTPSSAGGYDRMVSPTGIGCGTATTQYTTVNAAVMAALPNESIFVCAGTYSEPTIQINAAGVSLLGPGSTVDGEGQAILGIASGSYNLILNADNVMVSGLHLDATGTGTTGITGDNLNYTISNNVITGVTSSAIYIIDSTMTGIYNITNNRISSSFTGIYCMCAHAGILANVIESSTPGAGITAINVAGDGAFVSSNTVWGGFINVYGNNSSIFNNTLDGDDVQLAGIQTGRGTGIVVDRNHLSDTSDSTYALSFTIGDAPGGVTITRNTFDDVPSPIVLNDQNPNDAALISATIGGAPSDANVFTNSGGTLDDGKRLLTLLSVTNNVSAENNNWGLCTAEDVQKEIYDLGHIPGLGKVDFDPFIPGPSCSGQMTWGNIDCDGVISALDALALIRGSEDLPYSSGANCPQVGQGVLIAATYAWGDIDCDGFVDAIDAVRLLANLAGAPGDPIDACPAVGDTIELGVQ